MRIPRLALLLLGPAALLLAGCGTPGAPLPPTLDLPQPPSDLKATRKGNKVTLTWSAPTKTTDGALVKPGHMGATRVCRASQPVMDRCAETVNEVMPGFWQPGKPASYIVTLPPGQRRGFATYAVEMLNARGRSGGLSNQVEVPLAPTFAAPLLNARVTADGPELSWRPVVGCVAGGETSCTFRVRRLLQGAPPERESVVADIADRPGPAADRTDTVLKVTDGLAEWEKTYIYRVTPITHVQQGNQAIEVEGEDSAPVEVFAHDTFPPAVPSGVQAVYSGLAQQKFIDLTWAPVTDADLAGYNVYRREEGAAPVKITSELVKTPAFRDANIQPGHTYSYRVSATDLRGNESAQSQETSEQVPQQ
ncbi:MAG: fibronectin type III domain-containing protein [Candidatus Koribacter versatilis]|uniref:Fibronectin type III domain-containing protein n=1 Tax=Candidatus Korobacter versatilis TaxID=658062 RepID=A0A932ENS6_9BACT|nr:fibronectin type III domain-containing protein [Candidatus Koribacter versatilis]